MKTDMVTYNVTDQYVQTKRDFGQTTYFNLGTNSTTAVPWGHIDWFNFTISTVLTVAVNVSLVWIVGHWFKVW